MVSNSPQKRRGVGLLRPRAPRFLTVAALLALCFTAWVYAGIVATYSEILARDEARTPITVTEDSLPSDAEQHATSASEAQPPHTAPNPDAPFYSQYFHDALGELPIDASVLYLSTTSENPPPPPGLASWPEREGTYLSPSLARTLESLGQAGRYGGVLGTIPRSALASANEYVAYVFRSPEHIDLSELNPSIGFSKPESALSAIPHLLSTQLASTFGYMGTAEQLLPLWEALLLATLLVAVPSIYLAGLAATRNLDEHRKYTLICATLGYHRYERARIFLYPLGRTLLGTFVFAIALAVILPRHDIPLGFHSLTLSGTALHACAPIAVALTACFFSIYLAIYLHLRVKAAAQSGGRLSTKTSEYSPRRAGLSLVALAVNAMSLLPLTQHLPDAVRGAAYLVSLVVFLLGVRDVIAVAFSTLARRIRKRHVPHTRSGRATASLLLLASGLEQNRMALLRFASALAAALVLSSQILTYQILFASSSEETASTFADYHSLGASAYPRLNASTESLLPLTRAIDAAAEPGTLTFISTQELMLEGECPVTIYTGAPALFAGFGTSGDAGNAGNQSASLTRYLTYMNLTDACIKDIASLEQPLREGVYPTVHSISLDGHPLNHAAFQQVVHENTSPSWRTTMPGVSWAVGQEVSRKQLLWARLATGVGIAIVLLACAHALLEASALRARHLAAITLLYGSHAVLQRSTNLYIVAGLGVPALIGTVAGALLSYTLQGGASPELPVILAVTVQNLVLAAIALVVCLFAGRLATGRVLTRWGARTSPSPSQPARPPHDSIPTHPKPRDSIPTHPKEK